MNISDFFQASPSSYPALLWDFYIQYLWNYQPNSWVARIASTCRVLAVLVSLPIIILALLDISSYGIARTLGVIDDVKASTSDITTNPNVPTIRIISSTSTSPYTDSENESSATASVDDVSCRRRLPTDVCQKLTQESLSLIGASQPRSFYASDEEGSNFTLSGADLFSPAASRPSSPVLSRKIVEGGSMLGQEADFGRLRQRAGRDADIPE
ncbi:hypothetical protein E4T56_gene5941 [Termitomyces sp. T112]|nr:hypothetical protein C0989_006310 [Termitomyces sp. Mn162]KAG5718265.1 hypothetical protein E4T56_gene5941 [Termitomyces sp. T112]KAH0588954.1 hypothetical protein H2248_004736 [Termitomyces sp. 'cryptogamus']